MKALSGVFAYLFLVPIAAAQNFSVTTGTLDFVGLVPPGDDILLPGPVPILTGTPGVAIDVDGFSYGRTPGTIGSVFNFSVDFGSAGLLGSAVAGEVLAGGFGEQNVDVFKTDVATMPGTNVQIHDGNGIGPGGTAFPLGLMEIAPPTLNPFGTGVDGYDERPGPGSSVYWSWDPFSAAVSASPADVLISPAIPGYSSVPAVFASSFALGLSSLGPDNIDALEVFDGGLIGVYDPGDFVLFSLDPFSASLGAFGASPADILMATFGGPTGVFVPGAMLGLTTSDNMTALSVPSPSGIGVLALASIALVRRRR